MSDPANNTSENSINPFATKYTLCPICGTDTPYHYIKRSLYIERGKDIDLRPVSIEWKKEGLKDYHPHLYYFHHCSSCTFTAAKDHFENPVSHYELYIGKFTKLWKNAILLEKNEKNIAKILLQNIPTEKRDYLQSFRLNLLAIYQLQNIKEVSEQDSCNLGRYCLRLAWLYRQIRQTPDLVQKVAIPFKKLINILAPQWPTMPRSEPIALKMAAEYFKIYMEKSRAVDSVNEEISILLLITRIYLQLGNIPEAQKFLLTSKGKADQFNNETRDLVRQKAKEDREREQNRHFSPNKSKRENEPDPTTLLTESRKLKIQVENVQNIFEDCRDEQHKKHMQQAKILLANKKEMNRNKQRQLLIDHKINKDVINKLIPVEQKTKKKGILGIFG